MHPFEDMRLTKVLALYPSAIHKPLVVAILIGLAIIGGLVFSKAHNLENTMSDLEDVRKSFSIILLFLYALGRVSSAVD